MPSQALHQCFLVSVQNEANGGQLAFGAKPTQVTVLCAELPDSEKLRFLI